MTRLFTILSLFILLAVSLAPFCWAEDLDALKIIRHTALEKALIPISESYKKGVQRLLDDAITAKKLELALSLQAELIRLEWVGDWHIDKFGLNLHEDMTTQQGTWKVESGRVKIAVGEWYIEVDPKTKAGTMLWKGRDPRPVKLDRVR